MPPKAAAAAAKAARPALTADKRRPAPKKSKKRAGESDDEGDDDDDDNDDDELMTFKAHDSWVAAAKFVAPSSSGASTAMSGADLPRQLLCVTASNDGSVKVRTHTYPPAYSFATHLCTVSGSSSTCPSTAPAARARRASKLTGAGRGGHPNWRVVRHPNWWVVR